MAKHHMPTDTEVRERIEAIEDEQYRLAFMYQLIIAGRISEVCGEYAPKGSDAYLVNFEVPNFGDVDAVLFAVKTAKRDGKLRACAVPLAKEFEPWAQPLFKHFKHSFKKNPFMFAKKVKTAKRYAMWAAEKAFDGLEWPMVAYTKTVPVKIRSDQILDRGVDRKKRVYEVQFEDEERPRWCAVINRNTVKRPVKIYQRWKPFRSHTLRKRRTITLKTFYKFEGFDLAAYGGWTEKSQVDALPGALKAYLLIDIEEGPDALYMLKDDLADIYFSKLMKPYVELVQRDRAHRS